MLFILLIALIVLSAFFSATEAAFLSLSPVRVRGMVDKKIKNAGLVAKLKSDPHQLLITILVGNNIVNIGAAVIATVIATDFFGSAGPGIATGATTFLILIFGEITPKSLAHTYAEKFSLRTAKTVWLVMRLLRPLTIIFEYLTRFISKITKSEITTPVVSEDEVVTLTKMGVEAGVVEKREKELIEKVFLFNDITAGDVMTVREHMVCWNSEDNVKKALPYLMEQSYSRIPVYKDKFDNIVGIVYLRDVLKVVADNNEEIKLKDIAHQPYFIPEAKIIDDLFKEFQKKRIHMAIILNEYGNVAGLVTLENLLEELVGEIMDETDTEKNLIKRIDKYTILVDAKTEIEDINNFFNVNIPSPTHETISWLILKKLGEIPKTGRTLIVGDARFIVESATEKKIERVRIEKIVK